MFTVKEQQTFLKSLGLYDGKIDGSKGKKTIAGTEMYQRLRGLTVDGNWGKKTDAKAVIDSKPLKKGYVSAHFKKTEFKCGCKGKLCNGYNNKEVDKKLLLILETIREEVKMPIVITSGVRCQKYNDSIPGSAKHSIHILGGAADIYIPGVTNTKAGRNRVMKLAYELGAAYSYHGTPNMGNSVHINV